MATTDDTNPLKKMQAALAQKDAEQLKSFYTFNAKLLQFFKGIDEQFKALLNEPNLDKAVVDEIMQQTKAAIPDLNNLKYEMDMLDETVISNACRNDIVKLQKYITETMVLSQASFTKENFIALLEKNKPLFAAEKEQEKEKEQKEKEKIERERLEKIRKEEAQEQAKKQEEAERIRKIEKQKEKERLDIIRIEKEIEVKLRLEIEQKEKERLEKIRKEEAQEQAKKQEEAERLRKIEEQKEKERLDIIRIEKEIEVKFRLEHEQKRKEEENKEKERQLKLKKQQEEEARKKALEVEMVKVKGGTFTMLDSTFKVTLSSYSISQYPITQALWEVVMKSNPSSFKGKNFPVENVNWYDAQEFISKLNALTGKAYRLPTEAEWEFAARGGNKSHGYEYAGSNNLHEVGWFNGNAGGNTHPVGEKKANELGIYDMSGNVWEWCSDWHGAYPTGSHTNPQGAASGSYRVFRGGSWFCGAERCRCAYRIYRTPDYRNSIIGFRLVSPL